jgi:hypothetical protein
MLSPLASLVLAAAAPGLDLVQAWDDRPGWEAAPAVELAGVGAAPAAGAVLRVRWNSRFVFFEFVCRDRALVSPGREDGPDHFKIGDVVEIFLGPPGDGPYCEVHATPAGKKARFFFDSYRRGAASPPPALRRASVKAGPVDGGWRAVIAVPWAALGAASPGKQDWRVLAGRYDRDAEGAAAVLSSFPPQSGKPDFHDPKRFARLVLQP